MPRYSCNWGGAFDDAVHFNDNYTAYSNISSPNYIHPNIDQSSLYTNYIDATDGKIKLSLYYSGGTISTPTTIIWKQTSLPTASRSGSSNVPGLEMIDNGNGGTTLPSSFKGIVKASNGNTFLSADTAQVFGSNWWYAAGVITLFHGGGIPSLKSGQKFATRVELSLLPP